VINLLGRVFSVRAGTLGDTAWPVIGVNNLGGNGVLRDVFALIGI
jgi:hypothetical protein